jgi:hypothetical protein
VCGLFMIAEIGAAEDETEEFEKALDRLVHHRTASMTNRNGKSTGQFWLAASSMPSAFLRLITNSRRLTPGAMSLSSSSHFPLSV